MMNYQFVDTASWTLGNHLLQFGGDIAKVRRNGREYFETDTQFAFNGLRRALWLRLCRFLPGRRYQCVPKFAHLVLPVQMDPISYSSRRLARPAEVHFEPGRTLGALFTIEDAYGENAAFRAGQKSTVYPLAPLGYVFPGDTGIEHRRVTRIAVAAFPRA